MTLEEERDTLGMGQRWKLDLGRRARHATLLFIESGKIWGKAGWGHRRNQGLLAQLLVAACYDWPIQ